LGLLFNHREEREKSEREEKKREEERLLTAASEFREP
jgi:hypothetical protein